MSVVSKIINSIKAKSTQHRLFKLFLEDEKSDYKDLIMYTEVRWLSRGKVLERFIVLLPQVKDFLASRNEICGELESKEWLFDLGFLVDMTTKFNELNLKLQQKNSHIADMISAINSFQKKLELLKSNLLKNSLSHFLNLKKISESLNFYIDDTQTVKYTKIIDCLLTEFSSRFKDFKKLEYAIPFFINPFKNMDPNVLYYISDYFDIDDKEELEIEIINLQNDIVLKSYFEDKLFWKYVTEENFPILRKCALKIFSYCATTYNCEALFSNMTYLKSKYRTQLTDLHLDNCLRAGNSTYLVDYDKIADDLIKQDLN